MSDSEKHEVTKILRQLSQGDESAYQEIVTLLQVELHQIAHRQRKNEPLDLTLRTTEIVNEAYIKLVNQKERSWKNRTHFVRCAARAMRQIVVDHARHRRTATHGGEFQRVPLDDWVAWYERNPVDLLALDEALDQLEARDPALAQMVELRFFCGLTIEEIAEVMGRPLRTIERDWKFVKAWLKDLLSEGDTDAA